MKRSHIEIIAVVLFILILPFAAANYGIIYNRVIGKKYEKVMKDSEREVFKSSKPYVEGMVSTLASYKMQYDLASNEDKKIIANNIKIEYANFNPRLIENQNLRYFLEDINAGVL